MEQEQTKVAEATPRRKRLMRSFWLVGGFVGLRILLELVFAHAGTLTYTSVMFGFAVFALAVMVVLYVIDWRWANRLAADEGASGADRSARRFAKFGSLVGMGIALGVLTPGVIDAWHMMAALKDPDLADFTVDRVNQSTVRLTGAINDESVSAVIAELEQPRTTALWITSQGGLVEPALKLVKTIDERRIEVVADDYCISACVMVLAASPEAAIVSDTEVTFHQPQAVIDAIDPDNDIPKTERQGIMRRYYERTRIAPWAIERMMESEYWTPSFRQLVRMRLISFVYDGPAGSRYHVGEE